ncbi:MAG: aminomethyl transferase family protein [Phycisphaerales bacterium]|nr:aminomethyl transferase family protein [Phycisphaerales bacterium]
MRFASPLVPLHRVAFLEGLTRRAREGASRPGAATGALSADAANADAEYIAFGPTDAQGDATCAVVAEFEGTELEYAAIRRGAALFDDAWRGTIAVTGADRIDLLNRLVTQDLRPIKSGGVARGFLTNRKGRIDADLILVETGSRVLIDLVVHDASTVATLISQFVFSESVVVEDCTRTMHALSVHGPAAVDVLASVGLSIPEGAQCVASELFGGTTVFAHGVLGEPGFSIRVAWGGAGALWNAMREHAHLRCAGWNAYNIARIENGEPMFRIDFGSTNLPHETGVLDSRVSFTKGCYPGQEVVARMQHLGKPKQILVGLRVRADVLPLGEAAVFARAEDGSKGEQVGAITSSSIAPMLSAAPVAFAMLRSAQSAIGNIVLVDAEGEVVQAEVQPLRFFGGGTR